MKWIPLSPKKGLYLTLGGQYRPRVEYFRNVDYTSENQLYYSQRLALNANLNLKYCRVYGELFHGETSDRKIFLESDEVDWHQRWYLQRCVRTPLFLEHPFVSSCSFHRGDMPWDGRTYPISIYYETLSLLTC